MESHTTWNDRSIMVTNFEHITSELTQQELELIPILVKGFHKHMKENPILARDIVRMMNLYLKTRNYQITFTEARLRKCVNFIRTNAILPLMATSNGYYISWDSDEIYSQIQSLEERANSIKRCAGGLWAIMHKLKEKSYEV